MGLPVGEGAMERSLRSQIWGSIAQPFFQEGWYSLDTGTVPGRFNLNAESEWNYCGRRKIVGIDCSLYRDGMYCLLLDSWFDCI